MILPLLFLVSCGLSSTGTATLHPPIVVTTPPPKVSVEEMMKSYLGYLQVEDYTNMYALLSSASQTAVSEADFAKRHQADFDAMSLTKIDFSILSTLTNVNDAQVAYHINYETALFGNLQRDITASFSKQDGQWKLDWHDNLILPELGDGSYLDSLRTPAARGDIYDRNGLAIATQTDAVALGLQAGAVPADQQTALFNTLWKLTGVRPDDINFEYSNYPAGQYVPVGEASLDAYNHSVAPAFANGLGLIAQSYTSRYYDLASQAVGYTQPIFKEDVSKYKRMGYSIGQRVGRSGIEGWGEAYLAGKDGATLYIVNADKSTGSTIASSDPQPADSITLTLDEDLQSQAQQAMDGLPGAIVVLERDTGRVLAMVSSPALDVNMFDPENYNSVNLQNMLGSSGQPELNRATMGQYPLGSVFKTVTMAAALKSGVFTKDSTFDCEYDYTELVPHGGPVLHDWTWDHCQTELQANPNQPCTTKPSSPPPLTLPEGLMRSCDPWFYHIGFTLFDKQMANAIPDMARAFGLGKATGIEIDEQAGKIPTPGSYTEATSIAIGQGNVLVTPIQVADFISALGNGGTLYQPQLVEKVQTVNGDPVLSFKPQAVGTLPISPDDLQTIQQAMISVTKDPRGTAYSVLATLAIPTAAKTGTAESGTANPHAWFAGYSMANIPGKPDISVVVVVNNQGEGSIYALPIFRRVMEIYFYGHPQYVYRWETSVGVLRPTETATPTPTSP